MDQATTTTTATAQRVQWLQSLGCSPLPVAPAQAEPLTKEGKPLFNGKNPSYLDASGKAHLIKHTQYRETPPTVAELETWFANPQNGIGTLAGGGGIDWIDLDRKNFDSQSDCDNARSLILEKCPRTYFEKTKSGGAHIAVKLAEAKNFTNFELGNGDHAGEFLGHGRFVVLAPTPGYESQNGDEIASVQSAESLGLRKVGGGAAETSEKKEAVTVAINPNLQPVALEALISRKAKDILSATKSDDVSADLARLARELYGCAEWYPAQGLPVSGNPDAILQQAAANLGVDPARLNRITEPIPKTGNLPGLVKHGGAAKAIAWFERQSKKSEDSSSEDCAELKKIRLLEKHYEGRLRYNQLSQKIEIDGCTIEDIEAARIRFIKDTNKSVGVDLFCAVARLIAEENAYHPVARYLEKVSEKSTDTSILEGIAKRYFNVDDPLYDTYVKRWLISAVARIFEPGCKADCALFLQGGQGARKSTFFSRLAGDDFFSDSLGDTQSNKDEILLMHRFWIHEWSELETVFRKKEMASVKSFMARGFDSVRPPYRRDLIDLKRACVFAGTTNESSFLSDTTGDRRFWIIPVRGKIATDLLAEERDLIWAAAVALYRSGEQWHLTESEEIASGELNAQFRSLDPWHEKVAVYVAGREFTTSNEILTGAFEYELRNIGRKEQLRVSGILTSLGWENIVKKLDGKSVKVWARPVALKPESEGEQKYPQLGGEAVATGSVDIDQTTEPNVTPDKPADWQDFETLLIAAETYAELEEAKQNFTKELRREVLSVWKTDGRYEWFSTKFANLKAAMASNMVRNADGSLTPQSTNGTFF